MKTDKPRYEVSRFAQVEHAAKVTRLYCKAYRKGHRSYLVSHFLRRILNLNGEQSAQFLKLVEDTLKRRLFRGHADADEKTDRRIARLWIELQNAAMPYSCGNCNNEITGQPVMKDGRGVCAECAASPVGTSTPGQPMTQGVSALRTHAVVFQGTRFAASKAQDLLRQQYAPTGAAARAGLAASIAALRATSRHVPEASELVGRFDERRTMAEHYIEAYRHYCWTVHSLEDIKLAPFHVLASEGAVHSDKDHVWHMTTLARLCASDQAILLATPHKVVDLQDEASLKDGTDWWEELTPSGGEGMVVKPFQFVTKNRRGLVQPAVKCRGREYLRIIYGPEYTAPEHLDRLRARGLGTKRSLALREFALGVEALQRFVERDPLRRVHECVPTSVDGDSVPLVQSMVATLAVVCGVKRKRAYRYFFLKRHNYDERIATLSFVDQPALLQCLDAAGVRG